MRYSGIPSHSTGSGDLVGCLGVVQAESCDLDMLFRTAVPDVEDAMRALTKRLLGIVAHYGTEAPQVNFVSVTSFFNPADPRGGEMGGILGIDVFPVAAWPHPLVSEVRCADRCVPVYDLAPVAAAGKRYLEQYPIHSGSRVFEAHAEASSIDNASEILAYIKRGGRARLYATLAIGVSSLPGCRLLMEDAGIVHGHHEQTIARKAAHSILACEHVERLRGCQVQYDAIWLLMTMSDILRIDTANRYPSAGGIVPAWSQVQFLYLDPPKEFAEQIPPSA